MSRETQEQQRKYLSGLAARFQNIASLAVKAHYGGDDTFEQYPMLKLATMIINRNDIFARDIATRGYAVQFGTHTDASGSEDGDKDGSEVAGDSEDGESDESWAPGDSDDNEDDDSAVIEAVIEAVGAPLHTLFARAL